MPEFIVDEKLISWMKDIRRHIHSRPEIAFGEQETSAYIRERLDETGIADHRLITETGIRCIIEGDSKNKNQKCVALRADMDGLPIQEDTGLAFSSEISGVMHACGHDAHVAMLLGAAALLQKNRRDLSGRVVLLFQPAEESGNGAEEMIGRGAIDGVDAIFAGHIDTHFSVNTITVDSGIICAWADPFSIKIKGRGGHAARPHETADAVVAAASLVMTIQTLVARNVDPNHSIVVTVGSLQAGTIHNVIAGEAALEGTIRSTHPETRKKTIEGLQRMVQATGEMYGVEADIIFRNGLPAVLNHPDAAARAEEAARMVCGKSNVVSQGLPSMGGEDFSFYQQQIPGCLVRFGAEKKTGAGPAHSSTFDFDEQVLAVGAAWLAMAAVTWLEHA